MFSQIRQWFQKSTAEPASATDAGKDARGSRDDQEKMAACFQELGVEAGSNLKTVREAWKRELARYHRDLYSEDAERKQKATLRTQRVNDAYRFLQDALF